MLDRVIPEKIQKVEDFVQFLTEKDAEKPGGKEVRKMEGIWIGLGSYHEALEHEHAHVPDLHHRHSHGKHDS